MLLSEGRVPPGLMSALVIALVLHLGAAVAYKWAHRSAEEPIVLPLSFHVMLSPAPVPPSAPPAPKVKAEPAPEAAASEPAEPVPVAPRHAAIVPKPDRAIHVGGGATAVMAPKGTSAAVQAPAEVQISAGSITGNFEFGYYLAAIRSAIQRVWSPPRGAATGGALDATLRFTIHRDGSVTDASVETPSGLSYFDQSALAAVRGANLPPLPHAYDSDQLVVHFGFHYAE